MQRISKVQGSGQKQRNMARKKRRVQPPSCACGRGLHIGHAHFVVHSEGLRRICCHCFGLISAVNGSQTLGMVLGAKSAEGARHERARRLPPTDATFRRRPSEY